MSSCDLAQRIDPVPNREEPLEPIQDVEELGSRLIGVVARFINLPEKRTKPAPEPPRRVRCGLVLLASVYAVQCRGFSSGAGHAPGVPARRGMALDAYTRRLHGLEGVSQHL